MSSISFSSIPDNWRVPGAYAEFSNENAIQGLVAQPYTTLIIGQMFESGSKSALEPIQVTSPEQAALYFGEGSMLHNMYTRYKDNDKTTKTICIGALDDSAAAAATGSIAFAGTATESGTVNVYINGVRIKAGVSSGDNAETVAAAISDAIAAEVTVVSAKSTGGVITLTANHKGEVGNDIDLRFNYYTGQEIPSGLTTAITEMSGGTTNPDIEDVIEIMSDTWYNIIVCPWTDAANLSALESELNDRFGPMTATDGVAFAAKRANHSDLTTLGQSRNSPHCSIFESTGYPIGSEERAAMIAAQIAFSAQNDPARPFQTLALSGDMPPAEVDRYTDEERNLLLYDGISTCYTDAGGVVRIQRAITTYTENAFGGPDESYLDVNTLFTLSYLRYTWIARQLQKFPRFKLGDNGSRGDFMMTPKRMDAEMVAIAGDWVDEGLIESVDAFKAASFSERDSTDNCRLNSIMVPDLVNQLRIMATRIDFIL